MYCKNCGNLMDDHAAVCIRCGCARGVGNAYCWNCGQPITPGAAFCTSCGAATAVAGRGAYADPNAKSKLVAGLLGIFLGYLGIHNFYLGNTGRGVAQLVLTIFSCGVAGLWGFIEGILILCGNINTDAQGRPLTD